MAQKIALSLNIFSAEPLSRQLYTSLLAAIKNGHIRPGEKLPSIRDMSKQLQISTITVREAIDKLIELGLVTARHGSGNYVSGSAGAMPTATPETVTALKFTQATYESADWQLSDKFAWSEQAHNMNKAFNDSAFHPWWDLPVEYDFRVYQPGLDPAEGLHWNKIIERHISSNFPANSSANSSADYHIDSSAISSADSHINSSAISSADSHIDSSAISSADSHINSSAISSADSHIDSSAISSADSHIDSSAISSADSSLNSSADSHINSSASCVTRSLPDIQLNDPQGSLELRIKLSHWLNCIAKLDTTAADIFLVCGAQQARDLAARILVKQGTTVLVEEPGSITDLLAYASKGAQFVHVAQDQDGLRADLLSETKQATVAHLITSANFPSGASLSKERAQAIIAWAKYTDVTVVEDAYGNGFVYGVEAPVSLLGLASTCGERERIIYIGSLSQLFNPALRLAFLVVPKRFHNAFATAAWLARTVPSQLSQQLMLSYFAKGYFEEDVLRVAQTARSRRQALLTSLERWPTDLISFVPVRGGFHQTVWFDQSVDDLRVFEKALVQGIGVVPLSPYYHGANSRSGISLSFAQINEAKIEEGLARLLPIVEECRRSQAE